MITRPDEYAHNNPANAIADANNVRGAKRKAVNDTELLLLSTSIPDKLTEGLTEVYVQSTGKTYRLLNIATANTLAGWEEVVYGTTNVYATETEAEIIDEPTLEDFKIITLKVLLHWWNWLKSTASRFRLPFLTNATVNPRLTQVDSNGELSAPADNQIMDGFITDIDVIAAIVTATYNLSNAYTVSITPANSKKALAGQLYVAGGFLYVVVAENIISRYGIQTLFTPAVGSTGTAPSWSLSSVEMGNTLTLNIPLAAAANTSGTISNAAQTIAGAKTLTALLTCQAGVFIAASGSRNAAAALQVDSTTQGILFPRMTGAQMNSITAAPDGLMVHVTDAVTVPTGFYGRVDGAWVRFNTGVIDVLGTVLTGLNIVNAAIVASDNILQAFGKTQGQINNLASSITTINTTLTTTTSNPRRLYTANFFAGLNVGVWTDLLTSDILINYPAGNFIAGVKSYTAHIALALIDGNIPPTLNHDRTRTYSLYQRFNIRTDRESGTVRHTILNGANSNLAVVDELTPDNSTITSNVLFRQVLDGNNYKIQVNSTLSISHTFRIRVFVEELINI